MSQRDGLVPVAPDEGAVKLTVGSGPGGAAAAASSERLSPATSVGDETWLLSAVEATGGNAGSLTDSLRSELVGARLDDPGAVLKQLFRKLNSTLYQQSLGDNTATAVALVAKGKYATIAQTGDGQVYLMRAGRLNQVTRPAATPTPLRSGKAKPISGEAEPLSQLLGAREKLDARQPSIFELTLLPEDRLMICTGSIARSLDEKSLIAQLAVGDIDQSLAVIGNQGGAAAVATVAAARERQPVLVSEPTRTSIMPIVAAIAAVLIIVVVVLLYGYL